MNETTPNVPAAAEPVDAAQAIWQLRSLVCALGAMVLVFSLTFNVFIMKQNRNIQAAENNRKQMIVQADNRLRDMTQVANDLATYSSGKPELVAIFSRFGMALKQGPAKSATPETESH